MIDDDAIDLGPCCACRKIGPTVRNLMMLPFRAPMAGKGWGCFQCGLPNDGALAVLCDACLESGAPIVDACAGYPSGGVRVPRENLTEPFDHDMRFHEDEE